MADMPMPPAAPQAAPKQEQGQASKLVVGIHDQMSQLMSLLENTNAVAPDVKAKFGQLISQYESLVESALGGGAPQEEMPVKGNVPVETGGKDVKPVL
jgi:hypothetical protein